MARVSVFLFLVLVVQSTLAFSVREKSPESSFANWAEERGVKFAPSISVKRGSFGWGVVLKNPGSDSETVKEGSTILTVPRNLVWNAQSIHDDLLRELPSGLAQALDLVKSRGYSKYTAEFLLFVKLLQEKSSEESEWRPWLETIPSTFHTGLSMTDGELNCLTTFCRALAESESLKFRCFKKASELLFNGDRELEEEELEWAYNVVYSRSWRHSPDTDDDDLGCAELDLSVDMVPVGDMFNHGEPANIIVSDDFTSKTVDFQLVHAPLPNGEDTELNLSYGLSTSLDRFLILFGFVDEKTELCFSEIAFSDPSKELVDLGCRDRSRMMLRCDDGAVSNTVYDCVLYAILEKSLPAEKKQFYDAVTSGSGSERDEFHSRYQRPVTALLARHFQSKLQELQQLAQVISETPDSATLRVIYQHNRLLTKVYSKALARFSPSSN